MAKWSKIFDYVLNPIGSLIGDIADSIAPGNGFGSVFTPFGAQTWDNMANQMKKDTTAQRVRSQIEDAAKSAGMSLDEYLAAYPDIAYAYEHADEGLLKQAFDKISSNSHIESLIDNFTGERDTEENEKNRQFQHAEAETNRQWEAEQAQAAREWDSIGAQMERASAAGVNPISIAMQNGGINGSATTSIPSVPSTPLGSSGLMHNGALDIANMIFSGIGTLAENRLKQSQSDDIVMMRQYNIAEKIANTDHLRSLCQGQELSNVSQSIQNQWLDVMNQATYDGMLLENGVKRATILEKRSVAKLNGAQIASIKANLQMDVERFNATLPLELQLTEAEINLKNASIQQVYTEISMRHLQKIEQESRNIQAAAEAESAQNAASLAKATFEDAISAFHNDMVRGAAEAGIRLNDYMYYGASTFSATNFPSQLLNTWLTGRKRFTDASWFDPNIKGVELGSPNYQGVPK